MRTACTLLALGVASTTVLAQPGWVLSHQKISDTEGGFIGILDNGDRFGHSAAALGDLDGDDVGDLAAGAYTDDDGDTDRGAVWMLFLDGVPTCPADINGDGELNVLDFVVFQLLWQAGDAAGDCDANGIFNVLDFVCFQQLFVDGCE